MAICGLWASASLANWCRSSGAISFMSFWACSSLTVFSGVSSMGRYGIVDTCWFVTGGVLELSVVLRGRLRWGQFLTWCPAFLHRWHRFSFAVRGASIGADAAGCATRNAVGSSGVGERLVGPTSNMR